MKLILSSPGPISADDALAAAIVQLRYADMDYHLKVERTDDENIVESAYYVIGVSGITFRAPPADIEQESDDNATSAEAAWKAYGRAVVDKVLGLAHVESVADWVFDRMIFRGRCENKGDPYSIEQIVRVFDYRDEHAFDQVVLLIKGLLVREILNVNTALGLAN